MLYHVCDVALAMHGYFNVLSNLNMLLFFILVAIFCSVKLKLHSSTSISAQNQEVVCVWIEEL